MKKDIIMIDHQDDAEVYAREGYKPGSPAVKVIWGYSTGSETGLHNELNTFAIAAVGVLDADGNFDHTVYDYEGWNPDDDDEINWTELDTWTREFCEKNL